MSAGAARMCRADEVSAKRKEATEANRRPWPNRAAGVLPVTEGFSVHVPGDVSMAMPGRSLAPDHGGQRLPDRPCAGRENLRRRSRRRDFGMQNSTRRTRVRPLRARQPLRCQSRRALLTQEPAQLSLPLSSAIKRPAAAAIVARGRLASEAFSARQRRLGTTSIGGDPQVRRGSRYPTPGGASPMTTPSTHTTDRDVAHSFAWTALLPNPGTQEQASRTRSKRN
jgi:hypothetical protein